MGVTTSSVVGGEDVGYMMRKDGRSSLENV